MTSGYPPGWNVDKDYDAPEWKLQKGDWVLYEPDLAGVDEPDLTIGRVVAEMILDGGLASTIRISSTKWNEEDVYPWRIKAILRSAEDAMPALTHDSQRVRDVARKALGELEAP